MDLNSHKRRVLLMYITKVSGHRQATLAIQEALRKLDPQTETPTVNGFGYTYPFLEKIVNQAYMSVIHWQPRIWDVMYDNPKLVKNSQSFKKFLYKTSRHKIAKLFDRYQPDTVVCTQAFPCGMVADYKQANNLDTKLIGVLTDFSPHSYWINEGIDYYIVPSHAAKNYLINKGVSSESVKVFGIPLRAKFIKSHDKKRIASNLGLNPEIPTILIMGGGQGLGPINAIVKSLVSITMKLQIIVITGTNKKVLMGLEELMKKTDKKILAFEFANNVDELMELATIIISKPGGLTVAESLAKGLPMMVIHPIPGQEMRNKNFLINNKIGVYIKETSYLGRAVEALLTSLNRLESMRQAAYDHARPFAAMDIAKLILDNQRKRSGFETENEIQLKSYV